MNQDYQKEQQYIRAKKKVKQIKGFYSHLSAYVIINICISGIIIWLSYEDDYNFISAIDFWGVFHVVILGNWPFLSTWSLRI